MECPGYALVNALMAWFLGYPLINVSGKIRNTTTQTSMMTPTAQAAYAETFRNDIIPLSVGL
jgi:hypothetical protein